MDRGKVVIAGIFLTSIVAALFGVWFQHQTTKRSLGFWGTEAATLIVQASRIELLQLAEPENNEVGDMPPGAAPRQPIVSEQVLVGDRRFDVRAVLDVSTAPGMTHIRRGLVSDSTYDWSDRAQPPDPKPADFAALRFIDEGGAATVLLDLKTSRASLAGGAQWVALDPTVSREMASFVQGQQSRSLPGGESAQGQAGDAATRKQ